MTSTFETGYYLDSVVEWKDGEFVGDYKSFFEDGDLESLGIDPVNPTESKPGSVDKVRTLAARYAAGLPLWHKEDCYDHAPTLSFDDEG